MKNPFTKHPNEVNETYFEHMKHALWYSGTFAILAVKSLIHAIFPWLFNGPISAKCCELADHMRGRLSKKDSKNS